MAFLRFRSVYCIPEHDISHSQRTWFSSVCIMTATLSAYGACVQLKSLYHHLKDGETRRKPSSNPTVMFCLALADLFTCIGVICMSILLMTLSPPHQDKKLDKNIPNKDWYKYIDVPIESFTMFAYISSYMWTLAYALDICLQVYNKDKSLSMKAYMIWFWLAPVWLVVCGQFVNLENSIGFCSVKEREVIHFMVCFVPLVCVFISLPVVYLLALFRLGKTIRTAHGCYTNTERELMFAVKKKFFRIVFVFMFCWITNVVDGVIDLIIVLSQNGEYIKERGPTHFKVHFAIWIIEAFVNPLQGFLNCLVYGQARKLLSCCQNCCKPSSYTSFLWPEARSDPSESFLINSHETLERRPILDRGHNEPRKTYHSDGKTSPFYEAKKAFTPRLLGEPRIT